MLKILRFYITFILLILWCMRKYKFLLVYACIAFFDSTKCVAQQGPPPPPPDVFPPPGDVPIDNGLLVLAIMALFYGCYIIYKNKKRAT